MRSEYRQSIQIGKNPNGILALPCVDSVRKSFEGKLIYQVNTECDPKAYATAGDWICEDYNGDWHVVSDEVMAKKRTIESEILECDGIPFRIVDNKKFTDERFAPRSIYLAWQKNNNIPRADDLFRGYVPDSIFFNATAAEFETYVNNHFIGYEN